MKVMRLALLVGALGTVAAAGAARADVVDFDEFTSPPVTCCYIDTGVLGPLVYTHVTFTDGAGQGSVMNGSGWNDEQTSGDNLFGTLSGLMTFTFNTDVSNLAFDLINGLFETDDFLLTATDAHGGVISTQTVTLADFTGGADSQHIVFADSGIRGFSIAGNDDFAIDTVSFEAAGVPEASTWALMIGGFGLAGAMLRKRRAIAATG